MPMYEAPYDQVFKRMTVATAKILYKELLQHDTSLAARHQSLYYVNKHLHDKFFYEFRPAITLGQAKQVQFLTIVEDDNLRYDAKFELQDNSTQKVEFVTAIDHIGNHHRRDYLKALGYDLMHNYICRNYSKSGKGKHPNNGMSEGELYDLIAEEITPLIVENFNKKLALQQEGGAYAGMVLGIIIDSNIAGNRIDILDAAYYNAITHIKNTDNDFIEIYLMNPCGDYLTRIK
jgi:hypothetical protein